MTDTSVYINEQRAKGFSDNDSSGHGSSNLMSALSPLASNTTFGRIRPLDERLASIQNVTVDDVQRVALTYLVDEQRSVVHVVSPPAGESGGTP